MTRVLLAGGGTAGHVNPLLAVANELVRQGHCEPSDILVVGTAQGLESRLVPAAGFSLATTARLPMPRKMSLSALVFWPRFGIAVGKVAWLIMRHRANVVAGFGGYASAPSYVAAWLTRTPLVIHEATNSGQNSPASWSPPSVKPSCHTPGFWACPSPGASLTPHQRPQRLQREPRLG
jgi:UDP-N-acetylglucosamine--N-acetylmuramyl-(pentapeptide) pyrophosphoryl-undecaprenol N-acetylglucosamine transferase